MAAEEGDERFVSKLTEAGRKKAKEELNEINDKDRVLAVQSLRKWVLEQPWLKTPTDFEFLLRFLRVRKYSQLSAREALVNFWTNRTKTPEWFSNVDPADPDIQRMIRTGLFLVPPNLYDKQGRRLCFGRVGNFDTSLLKEKKNQDLLYKTNCLIFDWLSCDENAQVYGVASVSDYTGMSLEMMKLWNSEYSKKSMSYFQHSLPMRYKAGHLYNEPVFMDAILAIVSPFMSQKLKSRMHMHGKSLVKIYDDLGMECFPQEYLPDDYEGPSAGSIKDMPEKLINDMMRPEFRNYIVDLSSGKYGVDLAKKKAAESVPAASFRKLNTD